MRTGQLPFIQNIFWIIHMLSFWLLNPALHFIKHMFCISYAPVLTAKLLSIFSIAPNFIAKFDCRLFKGLWLLISMTPQSTAGKLTVEIGRELHEPPHEGTTKWWFSVKNQWQFHYIHPCHLQACPNSWKLCSLIKQVVIHHLIMDEAGWLLDDSSSGGTCFIAVAPKFRYFCQIWPAVKF